MSNTFSVSFICNRSTHQNKKIPRPRVLATASFLRSYMRCKKSCLPLEAEEKEKEEESIGSREKLYTALLHETRAKGHTFLPTFEWKLCRRFRDVVRNVLSTYLAPNSSGGLPSGWHRQSMLHGWKFLPKVAAMQRQTRCSSRWLREQIDLQLPRDVRETAMTAATDRAFGVACKHTLPH